MKKNFEKDMADLIVMGEFIAENMGTISELSKTMFCATIGTMVDTYCQVNGGLPVEIYETIMKVQPGVAKELGDTFKRKGSDVTNAV